MRAGIARVADRAPTTIQTEGEGLAGVDCTVGPYSNRATSERPASPRLEFHYLKRAARLKDVVTVRDAHSLEDSPHAARPDHCSPHTMPRAGTVCPRPEEGGKVAHVVCVEVRDCNMGNRPPFASVPVQTMHGAGATVEQDPLVAVLDEVCGRAMTIIRKECSRADDGDSHWAPFWQADVQPAVWIPPARRVRIREARHWSRGMRPPSRTPR